MCLVFGFTHLLKLVYDELSVCLFFLTCVRSSLVLYPTLRRISPSLHHSSPSPSPTPWHKIIPHYL